MEPRRTSDPGPQRIYYLYISQDPKSCTSPKNHRKKIAVVDDEKDLANLFGDVISSRGYTVDVFTDPRKALEKIKAEHNNYSLLLTYVRIPGLTGVELGKQILTLDQDVKIILISAYELIENPGLQYIKKPIGVSELIELDESKLSSSQH